MPASSSYLLNVHAPKKDVSISTTWPSLPIGDDEVLIRVPGYAVVPLIESIFSTFQVLKAAALTNLKDSPELLAAPVGGTSADVEIDGEAEGLVNVNLWLGAGVSGKQQSHFIARTIDRLLEAFLEDSKGAW